MAEDLEIKIGADTSQLNAELQAAQNEFKRLEAQIRKTSDVKEIQKLQTSLRYVKETMVSLEAEGAKLNTVLDKGLKKGAGGAAQTLTDLSRIAQDAPYGFIAISNNINPLVESFGRLKAETGSTGGALKSLAAGLIGGGGLGVAFAVVTSAISFAQVGFSMWTRESKKAKEAVDEQKKAQEEFKKSIDGATAGALASGLQLQAYVNVAKNGQLPIEQRNQALKEANKILGEHGDKLTLANVATAAATKEVELYTQALIAEAVAGKYVNKLAELTVKQTELTKQQTQAQKDLTAATTAAGFAEGRVRNKLRSSTGAYTAQANEAIDATVKRNKAQKDLNATNAELAKTTAEIANLQNDLNAATDNATKAYGALGTKAKENKSHTETWAEALAKFEKELKTVQQTGLLFNIKPADNLDEQIKKIEGIITDGLQKFGKEPQDIDIQKLNFRLKMVKVNKLTMEALNNLAKEEPPALIEPKIEYNWEEERKKLEKDLADKKFFKEFNRAVETSFLKKQGIKVIPAEFTLTLTPDNIDQASDEAVSRMYKAVTESLKTRAAQAKAQQTEILSTAFGDVLTSFGENLGAAIASGNFGSIFQGLFDVLGNAAIQLGKNAILFSEAFAAIKKALAAGGLTVGIGAGLAMIALGALIKAAGKKLTPQFATGTTFAPGGMALVGERGPELVNIPRGSQVIPTGRTSSMMGALQSVEVYGMLRGQDIYFSNKKYSQTYNRQT